MMQAKKMLKNLRVKAKHNNMEFKIIGLSDQPCSRQMYGSALAMCFLHYSIPLLNGFFPLQTNGGYCSMHLNKDIVNVLNTSIAAILPALTQQLLVRWTS